MAKTDRRSGFTAKAEATIEGVVYALVAFLRTIWLLINPCLWTRAVRLLKPGSRRRHLPPFLFLSISSFLLALLVNHIAAGGGMHPRLWLNSVKSELQGDISIIGAIRTALPIFLSVILSAYILSRVFVKNATGRSRFFHLTCYSFGFLCSIGFLSVLGIIFADLFETASTLNRFFWLVRVPLFIVVVYAFLRMITLMCVALWTANRGQSPKLKLLKTVLLVVILPYLIWGCFELQLVPGKISRMLAAPKPEPVFYYLPADRDNNAIITCEPYNRRAFHFKIFVRNRTDAPILLYRRMGAVLFGDEKFVSDRSPDVIQTGLTIEDPQTDKSLSQVLVGPQESKSIACRAVVTESDYEKLKDKFIHFAATARWRNLNDLRDKEHEQRVGLSTKLRISDFPCESPVPAK